jgi:hypothetical protein
VLLCVAGYYGLSKVRAAQPPSCSLVHTRRGLTALDDTPALVLQFVTGKYDAIDSRVKKSSERSAQLEEEHKVSETTRVHGSLRALDMPTTPRRRCVYFHMQKIMSKLATEEFVLRPVPPPREDDSGLR